MAQFKRVTIIGLGLMGGSLGMAIRRKRMARAIVGFSRKRSTLRIAKRRGAIDAGTTNLADAVRGADLVVLASPVETIVPMARRILPLLPADSVLMDLSSTKGAIVRSLERLTPYHVSFIGAHPLAGSEQRGIDAADARLYDGSLCILTKTVRTDRHALRAVSQFWRRLGCRVSVMDPTRHDRLLAAVSHLPHLLAFCLTEATDGQALAIAPRSFLDATRVAKSDPELWNGIFLSNRPAISAAIAQFERRWRHVRARIARGDRVALYRFLASAKGKRDALD